MKLVVDTNFFISDALKYASWPGMVLLEGAPVLSWSEYSEHPDVTRRLVKASIRTHAIQRPIPSRAGQFAHAPMGAKGRVAWVLDQTFNRGPQRS